jgi:hypothetical protein
MTPLRSSYWPAMRILVAPSWGSDTSTSCAWSLLPMLVQGRSSGFRVLSLSRYALPQIGEARLIFEYGRFATGVVGGAAAEDVPDLNGKEIRIQAAPRGVVVDGVVDTAELPADGWRTVWWGVCEYAADQMDPGAPYPQGSRTYYCFDGLQRARFWQLRKHGLYLNHPDQSITLPSDGQLGCEGHPGYNTGVTGARGNREATNTTVSINNVDVLNHCPSGVDGAEAWTDLQVVQHALDSARGQGTPRFDIVDPSGLLSGTGVWPVEVGDTALDIVTAVCDRRRGRGCAFVSWADDSGDPEGPLTAQLVLRPQVVDDLVVYAPGSGDLLGTLHGATTAAATVTVDLVGDHRCGDFELARRHQNLVDELESAGNYIQVLCSARIGDGASATPAAPYKGLVLTPAWSAADRTAFIAATAEEREDTKYDQVYQVYQLATNWTGKSGDGNAVLARVDYRCGPAGEIITPPDAPADTSPLMCSILPDLPLYEAYNYDVTPPIPAARLPATSPVRAPLRVFRRISAGSFEALEDTFPYQVHVSGNLLKLDVSDPPGYRSFAETLVASLQAVSDYTDLVFLVGIELPHRVSIKTAIVGDVRRRRQIIHEDISLWLAPSVSFWRIETDGTVSKVDGATSAMPAATRDDREELAWRHALAWEWYRSDRQRLSGFWDLNCCGVLPDFEAVDPEATEPDAPPLVVAYPQLGQVVTTLNASGIQHQVNSPITGVVYDHQTGVTRWTVDWAELDSASVSRKGRK